MNCMYALHNSPVTPGHAYAQFDARLQLLDKMESWANRLDIRPCQGIQPAKIAARLLEQPGFSLAPMKAVGAWKTSEVKELLWVFETCQKFLASDSQYLLLINSQMWFPEDIRSYVESALSELPSDVDVLRLYTSEAEFINLSEIFRESESKRIIVNKARSAPWFLLLTRTGAAKYLSDSKVGFDKNLTDLLFSDSSEYRCYAVNPNFPNRPSVWTEIFQSWQAAFEEELPYSAAAFHHAMDFHNRNEIPAIKIETYISHWFRTIPVIDRLVEDLSAAGLEPQVLNGTDEKRPEWLNIETNSFFKHLRFACERFSADADYLFFLTADIESQDWRSVIDRAKTILGKFKPTTLSPSATYDSVPAERFGFINSHSREISVIRQNDIVCIFIHKDAVAHFQEYFKFFERSPKTFDVKVGFGLGSILNFFTYESGGIQLKDVGSLVFHPHTRSYISTEAEAEDPIISEIYADFLRIKGREVSDFKAQYVWQPIAHFFPGGLPFDVDA